MAEPRSVHFRGTTRDDAERAYHRDARAQAEAGYVPVAEEWSTALGQQVLSVAYTFDPDEAPAALRALDQLDLEAAVSPAPAQRGEILRPPSQAAPSPPRGAETSSSRDETPVSHPPTAAAVQHVPASSPVRIGVWILTIASVAGYLWIWGTLGTGDLTTRIVLEFMLGVIWTMVVVFIGGAILFVFGLGSFLFRGR